MNLLFVCTENRLRSPTAELVFSAYPNLEVLSAGTNKDAETTVSGDLIEWADIVFVMEKMHQSKLAKKFKEQLKNKRLICLAIPDDYAYMQPELIRLLKNKVAQHIPVVDA